jgi:hypothetical protein
VRKSEKPVLRIHNETIADPDTDPAFFVKAEPDADPDLDPDPGF